MHRDPGRARPRPPRSRRSRSGLRMKGETVEEMAAPLDAMLDFGRAGRRCPRPRGAHRHLRHGRRPQRHDQRVARSPRSSSAGAGAKVCKHGNRAAVVAMRLGRPARGARRGHRPRPRRAWRAASSGRDGVLLRAPLPPGAPPRRSGPPRARRARPCSTSSGRWPTRPGSGARSLGVSDPAMAEQDGRRAPGQRRGAGPGRLRPRRPRRADDHRPRRPSWSCGTATSAPTTSTRSSWG